MHFLSSDRAPDWGDRPLEHSLARSLSGSTSSRRVVIACRKSDERLRSLHFDTGTYMFVCMYIRPSADRIGSDRLRKPDFTLLIIYSSMGTFLNTSPVMICTSRREKTCRRRAAPRRTAPGHYVVPRRRDATRTIDIAVPTPPDSQTVRRSPSIDPACFVYVKRRKLEELPLPSQNRRDLEQLNDLTS